MWRQLDLQVRGAAGVRGWECGGVEFSRCGGSRVRRRRDTDRRTVCASQWCGRAASRAGQMGQWQGATASCTRSTRRYSISRLTAARRVYLHRQIGMRMEAGYGPRAGDIAAELAMHFEQGRDARRAVTYSGTLNCVRGMPIEKRSPISTKGLALLTLPETPSTSSSRTRRCVPLVQR